MGDGFMQFNERVANGDVVQIRGDRINNYTVRVAMKIVDNAGVVVTAATTTASSIDNGATILTSTVRGSGLLGLPQLKVVRPSEANEPSTQAVVGGCLACQLFTIGLGVAGTAACSGAPPSCLLIAGVLTGASEVWCYRYCQGGGAISCKEEAHTHRYPNDPNQDFSIDGFVRCTDPMKYFTMKLFLLKDGNQIWSAPTKICNDEIYCSDAYAFYDYPSGCYRGRVDFNADWHNPATNNLMRYTGSDLSDEQWCQ